MTEYELIIGGQAYPVEILNINRKAGIIPDDFFANIPLDAPASVGITPVTIKRDGAVYMTALIERRRRAFSKEGTTCYISGRDLKRRLLQRDFIVTEGTLQKTVVSYNKRDAVLILRDIATAAGLSVGATDPNPPLVTVLFRHEKTGRALEILAMIAGKDFRINDDGSIDFKDVIGLDRTSTIVFEEGVNIIACEVIDEDRVLNRIVPYALDNRYYMLGAASEDATSQSRYGKRDYSYLLGGLRPPAPDDIKRIGDRMLIDLKSPGVHIAMEVIDDYPGAAYGVGDTVRIRLPSFDVDGPFKVVSIKKRWGPDGEHTFIVATSYTKLSNWWRFPEPPFLFIEKTPKPPDLPKDVLVEERKGSESYYL